MLAKMVNFQSNRHKSRRESAFDMNGNHVQHLNTCTMEGINDQEKSKPKYRFNGIIHRFNTAMCKFCAKMKNSILSRGKEQLQLHNQNSSMNSILPRPRILSDKQDKSTIKGNAIHGIGSNSCQIQKCSLDESRIETTNHFLAKMEAVPTEKDTLLYHHYQEKRQELKGFMEEEYVCVCMDISYESGQNTIWNTFIPAMETIDELAQKENVIHPHFCQRQNEFLEKEAVTACMECGQVTGCANYKEGNYMGRCDGSTTNGQYLASVVKAYPNALAIPDHWGKRRKTDFIVAVGDLSEFAAPRKKRKNPTQVELELEASYDIIVKPGGTWVDPCYTHMVTIYNDMKKHRRYDVRSVVDLVRLLRNAKHHCSDDASDPVAKLLLEQYVFLDYFPQLAVVLYSIIIRHGWNTTKSKIKHVLSEE